MTTIATARLTCEACPVQIEGTLDNGRAFYFRARYSHVTLSAGTDLEDAVRTGWRDGPGRVRIHLPELGEFGAGMIGEDGAWTMLHEMVGELG